jgi:hypothetical protein
VGVSRVKSRQNMGVRRHGLPATSKTCRRRSMSPS